MKVMVWFNMQAIPKLDINSVINSGSKFDISIKTNYMKKG